MHSTAPQQPPPAAHAAANRAAEQPYQMVADQPTLILAPPTPRPMKLAPQSRDWRERCRELAWAHGLAGMAQPLGRNQWADLLWRVPSQSEPGTVHTVRASRDAAYHCDCPAGGYSQPCGHVGAALFDGDAVEWLLDPREVAADETSAEYRAYFAWRTGIVVSKEGEAKR